MICPDLFARIQQLPNELMPWTILLIYVYFNENMERCFNYLLDIPGFLTPLNWIGTILTLGLTLD